MAHPHEGYDDGYDHQGDGYYQDDQAVSTFQLAHLRRVEVWVVVSSDSQLRRLGR